jgi:Fe-S cluster assembly protein SufD
MSVLTQQNFTQQFLSDLTSVSPKASFMPFEKIASALQFLEEKGIPNNKWEDYKYCNIEAILRKEFKTVSKAEQEINFSELKNHIIDQDAIPVFIFNGKVVAPNETINTDGLRIEALEDLSAEGKEIFENHFAKSSENFSDSLVALNTAYCGNGLLVHLKKGTQLDSPVYIIHLNTNKENCILNTRKLIVAEENSRLQINETYVSGTELGKIFENECTEIFIGKNAVLHHNILQNENDSSYKVSTIQTNQQQDSNYAVNTFTLGGNILRNNLNIVVKGEHAETHLNGLSISNGQQLIDHHTLVDHAVPNCVSNELYKGVANGKSTLIFNGKIFVRRDAQKINAYQSSKNILLSDVASVNTKPQLEIFANDVKCSHGTSTGKVDEEALFYLKSRGIGEVAAKKLLLQAFAGEVLEKVKDEKFRTEIEARMNQKIELNA